MLDKFAAIPWSTRLGKPVMANVRRLDRDLDAPFPKEITDLDAVLMVLFYHDTVWLKTDRTKMNKAVFDALRSGGIYGIVDHSARTGAGTSAAQTLHRIEEKTVIDEVTKAGFKLEAKADFLRNPSDKRDWNARRTPPPRSAGLATGSCSSSLSRSHRRPRPARARRNAVLWTRRFTIDSSTIESATSTSPRG